MVIVFDDSPSTVPEEGEIEDIQASVLLKMKLKGHFPSLKITKVDV